MTRWIGAILLFWGAPALGCPHVDPPQLLQPVEDPDDTTAPPAPFAVDVTIQRGRGPHDEGCGTYVTSTCDAVGLVILHLDLPDDAVGFRLEGVDGEPPDELDLVTAPIAGDEGALDWHDGATDEQEAFAFVLAVRAVDAAGNESLPLHVTVGDPGREFANTPCAVAPSSALAPWASLAVLAALRRRRAARA